MVTDDAPRLRAAIGAVGGPAAARRLLAEHGAEIPERTLLDRASGAHPSSSVALTALALELLAERDKGSGASRAFTSTARAKQIKH